MEIQQYSVYNYLILSPIKPCIYIYMFLYDILTGHPQSSSEVDLNQELIYLKEKVDAGADFIVTQFFYDTAVFLEFNSKCRAIGITCPILPG